MSTNFFVADLHIHIGAASNGKPIKVTASRDLTFANIAAECADRKGIAIAGVVDCAAPSVIRDIEALIARGEMSPLADGGLSYHDRVTMVLGAEFETREPTGGVSHNVSYFPDLQRLKEFSARLSERVTNVDLSSQAARMSAAELLAICRACGGEFIPAHAFTPFKSLYGNCARRLSQVFPPDAQSGIAALELGLSADSYLADRIVELAAITFVSNSDAHSLPRIGREYNILDLRQATYTEVFQALRRQEGRSVAANFGLDPRLGKYHRTHCLDCEHTARGHPPQLRCEACGSGHVVTGVLDRIADIADCAEPRPPEHRPPYRYQVPLQFVPKVGAVALNRLINRFGSEMAVLHRATAEEIARTVGDKIAALIIAAREGTLPLRAGGGGHYGRAVTDDTPDDSQLRLPV